MVANTHGWRDKMQKANQRELTGFSNQPMKEHLMADSNFTLTADLLKEVFEYDGKDLFWKIPTKGHKIGQKAGSTYSGYCCIKFNGKLYKAHRLIYLMNHGELPQFIDHIDGNPLNNKIENLRPANKRENGYNRKLNANNTTGVKGVTYDIATQKYRARVWANKKVHSLGFFDTIENAKKAVESCREQLHGEFARHL